MVTEDLYKEYMSKLLEADKTGCREIVNHLLDNKIHMKKLYIDLFQRSLYEVGSLWETNEISVAMEHLYTSITETLINLSYPHLFSRDHIGKNALVFCTPGEYHHIGPRMVADYFELFGWDSYFLGVNTPEFDLFKFIEDKNPDILAISMSVYINVNTLKMLTEKITDRFHDLKIIMGGQGFNHGGEALFSQMENVQVIRSLDLLEQKIFQE